MIQGERPVTGRFFYIKSPMIRNKMTLVLLIFVRICNGVAVAIGLLMLENINF